jgi:hypothetical protein
MQRTDNKKFTKLQQKIRRGQWDKRVSKAIHGQVGAKLPSALPEKSIIGDETIYEPENSFCPVLVTRNQTRAVLEHQRLLAVCATTTSDDDLPIGIFGSFATGKRTRSLSQVETSFLRTLPDSSFNKAPPFLALYPGAWMLITSNLNVACGLGQGTRCRVIGWPIFSPGTTFTIRTYQGCRLRIPSAAPLTVLVELTGSKLLAKPPGQPKDLPNNVVALPMENHRKSSIDLSALPNTTRSSVTVRVRQLPIRPADALTTYSVQSAQFQRFIIYETTPSEFYTQLSRGRNGLSSVSLGRPLPDSFRPLSREATQTELARLKDLHRQTKSRFDVECHHKIPSPDKHVNISTSNKPNKRTTKKKHTSKKQKKTSSGTPPSVQIRPGEKQTNFLNHTSMC